MLKRLGQNVRPGLIILAIAIAALVPLASKAAPYAAMVIDARTGEVLHSRNADTRLHPASLTKMMTLYIAFEAVENGEIGLDDMVTISQNAASEPYGLGLRTGQKIALRYLIRAAAIKSSNDAATAIGDAIEGNEAAFTARMNRTARAMGMNNTTFKNAHGLTEAGHLSTARDMTILGRHVLYDWPQYYNLFSRRTAYAGVKTVNHTNGRFLASYRGADGIKTGYTNAAGYNLVASAERGAERIITTVFGGTSTVDRNRRVSELMDLGFSRAPTHVAVVKPARPAYDGSGPGALAVAALRSSPRPLAKPRAEAPAFTVASTNPIEETLQAIVAEEVAAAAAGSAATEELEGEMDEAVTAALEEAGIETGPVADSEARLALTDPGASLPGTAPRARPGEELTTDGTEVVTRMSTSGDRHWGINIGEYGSRYQAEKILLQTALSEIDTLDDALRKVVREPTGFAANFVGLSEGTAELACRRLSARDVECQPFGPS